MDIKGKGLSWRREVSRPRTVGTTEVSAPAGRVSPANRRAAARALVRQAKRSGGHVPEAITQIANWTDEEVVQQTRAAAQHQH